MPPMMSNVAVNHHHTLPEGSYQFVNHIFRPQQNFTIECRSARSKKMLLLLCAMQRWIYGPGSLSAGLGNMCIHSKSQGFV